MFRAIIEIPKGCDRRIHFSQEKNAFVDFGQIEIVVNNRKMPIAYGFLEGIMNEKEGDEVDVLVFSKKELKTGDKIEVMPIALILRDDEDDKIVAVDGTMENIREWDNIPEDERNLILNYFGFRHKMISMEDSEKAIKYIKNSQKL